MMERPPEVRKVIYEKNASALSAMGRKGAEKVQKTKENKRVLKDDVEEQLRRDVAETAQERNDTPEPWK